MSKLLDRSNIEEMCEIKFALGDRKTSDSTIDKSQASKIIIEEIDDLRDAV